MLRGPAAAPRREPGALAGEERQRQGLAQALPARTRTLHLRAERSGFVADLIRGRGSRTGYLLFLRNLQPAYAYYLESGGRFELSGMFVISARPDGIESVTRFAGDRLLARLDVPRELA